jgi:hypothetical protein
MIIVIIILGHEYKRWTVWGGKLVGKGKGKEENTGGEVEHGLSHLYMRTLQ